MLTFRRFSSTESKLKLEEFFTYHTTKAELKPWIYRPKNANILLAMDLKDPSTKVPLKPRQPIQPLSKKVLDQYINSLEPGSRELVEWFKGWTNITPRKRQVWNYISNAHVQNMLMQSFFRIGSYAGLVRALYCSRIDFIKAHNTDAFDVEHFFNTILVCNLHRNKALGFNDPRVAQRKLINAWANVTLNNNETGLANSLVQALAKQQQFDSIPPLKGLGSRTVKLPQLSQDESIGKMAAQLSELQSLYLIARTVVQFDPAADAAIHEFVQTYLFYSKKLGKEGVYESNLESMKKLLAARQERAAASESESTVNAEEPRQPPEAQA